MMMNLADFLKAFISLTPRAIATDTTTNGTGIDTRGFKSALVFQASGVVTDGTYDTTVTDSTDNSTFVTPGAGTAAFAQVVAANDNLVWVGNIDLTHDIDRYIRTQTVSATTTTGALLCTGAFLSDSNPPPTQSQTVAFQL